MLFICRSCAACSGVKLPAYALVGQHGVNQEVCEIGQPDGFLRSQCKAEQLMRLRCFDAEHSGQGRRV